MALYKSLRRHARQFFGKKSNQDQHPFEFTISEDERERALLPPTDNGHVDTLHGSRVSDPFRPLEDIESKQTLDWVQRQNDRYSAFVAPLKDVEQATIKFLEKAKPTGMQETMPGKVGDKYTTWRKEPGETRWSLYLKDTQEYDVPARRLLNPLEIDPSGKTNITGANFTRDGKTLAYTLSVSGSDETTMKFMDVESGADLGLTYTKFRSSALWDRDGKGFIYRQPSAEHKGSFDVLHHDMGSEIASDKTVFKAAEPEMWTGYFRLHKDSTDDVSDYEFISYSKTEPGKNALLARKIGSGADFTEIFPFKEGTLGPIHEINGKIYAGTSLGAPNEKLIAFDINDPSPDKWQTILPENKDEKMKSAFVWQNRIFATYARDTGNVIRVFDLEGTHLHDLPVPPLSSASMGSIKFDDPVCLLTYNNFQESGNIYKYDSRDNTLTLFKKSQTPIDLKDCIVERLHATSKDGTKVPMTVIRHPETTLDGTAATLLYGYGGFNISLSPGFSASIAEWVRSGGIYVQANLRGGGEFGEAWYNAGRKENKQNVFDDYIACAEHLIAGKYTSPARLAIQGGSNGGLLTAATVLQRPDLFGAVISEVPVTDMFRFHIGSYYGYTWKSDYGDPDIRRDFNVAAKYSPLHNVKKDFKHPPVLVKTDLHDDRVLPWHGFKFAATLQAKEDPKSLTLMNVRTDGGHGGGMSEDQWRQDIASTRAFLHKTLGPVDQKAYKAKLRAEQNIAQKKKKWWLGK